MRWPDIRLPASTGDAVAALRAAHSRAAVERVEIACGAGVGRTGTALALLAVLGGVRREAVAWVRAAYHPRAVETRRQRRWLEHVAATLRPCPCLGGLSQPGVGRRLHVDRTTDGRRQP